MCFVILTCVRPLSPGALSPTVLAGSFVNIIHPFMTSLVLFLTQNTYDISLLTHLPLTIGSARPPIRKVHRPIGTYPHQLHLPFTLETTRLIPRAIH